MKRDMGLLIVILCCLALFIACNRNAPPPQDVTPPPPPPAKTAEEIAAEHAALRAELEYEPYRSMDELKAEAEAIFVGTVEKVTAPVDMVLFYLGEDSATPFYYAHTVSAIRVEQVIKGDISVGDTVEIRQPGAKGKADFFMTNDVLLTEGARGLFFTDPERVRKGDPPTTLRFEQGVFKITDDLVTPNFVQDDLMDSWRLSDVIDYLEGRVEAPAAPVIATPEPPRESKTALGALDSDYSVINSFRVDADNVLLALSKTLPENGLYVEYGQLLLLNTATRSQQVVYLGPMNVSWSDQLLYAEGRFVYQGSRQLIFMDEELVVQKLMDDRIDEHQLRLSPDLQKTAQVIDGVLYITQALGGEIIAQHEGDCTGLVWSPDSARIAFLSADQRRLSVVDGEQFERLRTLTLGVDIPHSTAMTGLLSCAFTEDSAALVLTGQQRLLAEMLRYDLASGEGQAVGAAPELRLARAGAGELYYLSGADEYSLMYYGNASAGTLELYRTQWPILAVECDLERQQALVVEYEQNQQQLYLLDISLPEAEEPTPEIEPPATEPEAETLPEEPETETPPEEPITEPPAEEPPPEEPITEPPAEEAPPEIETPEAEPVTEE